MADYKKSWGRIDELAIVPGSTDRTPYDVWLDHRLRANARKLTEGVEVVSCAMISGTRTPDDAPAGTTPFNGDLAWCSKAWSAPIVVPLLLPQGLTSIKMHAWAAIRGGGAISWKMDVVGDAEGTDILESATGQFASQALGTSQLTAELEFDSVIPVTRWAILRFWVQSGVASESTFQNAAVSGGITSKLVATSISQPAWDNRPADGTIDIRSVILRNIDDDEIGSVDVLGVDSMGNLIATTGNAQGTESIIFENLSVMQPRGVSIELVFDPDSTGAPPRVGLQAQQMVRGRLAMRNAYARQGIWERPRLVAWGPGGFVDEAGSEGEKQRRRWDWSMGTSSPAVDVTLAKIADSTLHVRRDDARLIVALAVICVYHGQLSEKGDPGPGKRQVISEDGETVWELVASLERDGATLTGAESTQDVTVATYSTSRALAPLNEDKSTPFLGQRNFEFFDTGTSTARTNREWAVREGQLFSEDMGLLSFVELEIDVSDVSDISEHVRLLVTAEQQSANFDLTKSRSELVCVGWSAHLETG